MQEFHIWWSDLTPSTQQEMLDVMGVTRDEFEYYSKDFRLTTIYLPEREEK